MPAAAGSFISAAFAYGPGADPSSDLHSFSSCRDRAWPQREREMQLSYRLPAPREPCQEHDGM